MVGRKIAASPSDRRVLVLLLLLLLILLLVTGMVVRVEILQILAWVRCGARDCGGSRVVSA